MDINPLRRRDNLLRVLRQCVRTLKGVKGRFIVTLLSKGQFIFTLSILLISNSTVGHFKKVSTKTRNSSIWALNGQAPM